MSIEDVVRNADGSIAAYRMSDGRMREKQPRLSSDAPSMPPEQAPANPAQVRVAIRRERFLLYAIILLGSAALGVLRDVPGGYILPRETMGVIAAFGITSVAVDVLLLGLKRKPRALH
jgi:hypothetical protein